MKTYKWTTENGAKVEITVENKEVKGMKVNGHTVVRAGFNGKGSDMIQFEMGGRRAGTYIPEEIAEIIWSEERAKSEKTNEELKKYYETRDKIEKAMNA